MIKIKCISFVILFLYGFSIFAQQTSPLTFSEIMFYPSEPNGEFVEIYNTSSTETIDIANYKFKYYTSSNNSLVPLVGGTKLGPGKFAVIFQGNYDFNNGIYKTLIPSDAIVLKVSSNNFGSSGMANTTSRTVYLIDPSGQTVDAYTYSADNSTGISDEKIILNKDNSSSNWQNSLRTHGTPGFKNSVSPTDYDLQIKFLNINPLIPRAEDSLKITFVVINKGRLTANNFSVSIFNDVNHDSIEQADENIFYQDYSELINGDSIVIQKSFYVETPGNYSFIANINFLIDEVLTNNRAIANVIVAEKLALYNDIVINEIMYAPINDEPEWIELYNRSNRKINLKNWKIADNSSSVVISTNDIFIDSNQYLIISKDASINNFYNITSQLIIKLFPTLNNAGDDVILRDDGGRTIDSLRYNPSWGGSSGKSLERILINENSSMSTNWGTSISKDKATPGKINSLTQKDFDLSIKTFYTEAQYAIVNKELLFKVEIENKGKNAAQNAILKLYKDVNANSFVDESELLQMQNIQSISSNEIVQLEISTDSITKGENNFILYIDYPLDEFIDDNTFTYKINGIEFTENIYDVIINEIMYAPRGDEPEWIELYNRSNHNINLKNWKVGDSSTLVEITTKDYELKPKEFLIISRDSTVVNFYPYISKLIICSLPTLNNSGDVVIVKDSYNRTIDSTKYLPDWGGNNGKSLERKDVDLSSIDKENWSSSISKFNATPGKVNSISQKDYDVAIVSFFSKSNYAEVGKSFVLSAIIKNAGKQKAENVEVQLYRDENLLEKKTIPVIEPAQELQIEFTVQNVTIGKNQFSVSINYSLDEYEENNTAVFNINGVEINVERGDIVINEIMYAPIAPEPEWVELYNRSEKEIDIKNYQVGNEVSKNVIIKTSKIIHPKEYVTIAKDTNIYSIYPGITNVIISNFPILNNNGGMIVISDSLGRKIDSVYYKSNWGGENGKSLERIDAFLSSTDSANWKSSLFEKGGTPNRNNSISRKNCDIAIINYSIEPKIPAIGQHVRLIVDIANFGKNLINAVLIINELQNNKREKLRDIQINDFIPDTNLKLEIDDLIHQIISKRKFEIILNLQKTDELDEDTTNNSITFTVYPSYDPNSVLVNEIMYNPINGEPEWIEIFNTSNYDIDLEGWSITDVLTNPIKTNIRGGIISKNSFTVISKDSLIMNYHKIIPSELIINQFANLNNDADGVVLKDAYDVTIDSLMYQKSWGGENGKSLERKSLLIPSLEKNNWGSSLDIELSTPGRLNSISRKANDIAIKEILTQPKYPNIGEEVNLLAKVLNCGLNTAQDFTVRFYFQKENTYQFFDEVYGNNLSADDSITIGSQKKLRLKDDLKIYCKIYMNNDEDTLNNIMEKELRLSSLQYSVLINEIMYNPFEGESEWIEIVNVSNHPINLKNWYVSDMIPSPTKSIITKEDEYLLPNEYAILANDTAKLPYYTRGKFFQTRFGTLNNTSDGINIYDFNGRMIDSVFYNSKWGNKKGFSLERISFAVSSTDSTNWSLSLSKDGATPGYENSLNNTPTYKKNSIVINEIMYEPASNNSEFIEFFNTTSDTIQIGGINLIFGKNGKTKLSDTYLLIMPSSFFIAANDSSIYKNYSSLKSDDLVPTKSGLVIINNSLSLSNDGCELILKDIKGNTIDSVYYLPNWHNKNLLNTKNKSLERINPYLDSNDKTNWSTSVCNEGATPLKQNSIYTTVVNSESKVTISPNPFSPDNDGFEDFTTINFDLSFKISQVRIRVYDSQGRLVRTLTHNMPAASYNSIIFDGLDDNGRPLRIGIYILLIEITNEKGNTEAIKKPIVIARKL